MNEIAKQAAVARLRKAMELEKLSTKDTAGCLGLNPTYISMFLNERTWNKCPAYAFERLIHWCNSGLLLRGMNEDKSVIKTTPEALKSLRNKLEELPHQGSTPSSDFVQTSIAGENPKTEITWTEQSDSMMTPDEAERINQEPDRHIDLKPGEEVEFRRTIKDEHIPVKSGGYLDLIEAIKLVSEKLPGNVSIEIRINNK